MKRHSAQMLAAALLALCLGIDCAHATQNFTDEGQAYTACVAAWSGGQDRCRRSHPYVGMKPNSGVCRRSSGVNVGSFTSNVTCWYEKGPVTGATYSILTMDVTTFSSGCASRPSSTTTQEPLLSLKCQGGCEVAKSGSGIAAATGRVCPAVEAELAPSKNNCCQSEAGQ